MDDLTLRELQTLLTLHGWEIADPFYKKDPPVGSPQYWSRSGCAGMVVIEHRTDGLRVRPSTFKWRPEQDIYDVMLVSMDQTRGKRG